MGETVTALLRSALRSWRSESARELRGSDYWRQAVRLLAVGVGVLVLLALVLR
ncbi:hypothetical protein [Streptomyces sp. NPDC050560]|uniref:hypothetical protein n=1 Tax=Streptomyces sp. NPDC050560 TaxID=3365630 RepID=UPI0037ADDE08